MNLIKRVSAPSFSRSSRSLLFSPTNPRISARPTTMDPHLIFILLLLNKAINPMDPIPKESSAEYTLCYYLIKWYTIFAERVSLFFPGYGYDDGLYTVKELDTLPDCMYIDPELNKSDMYKMLKTQGEQLLSEAVKKLEDLLCVQVKGEDFNLALKTDKELDQMKSFTEKFIKMMDKYITDLESARCYDALDAKQLETV